MKSISKTIGFMPDQLKTDNRQPTTDNRQRTMKTPILFLSLLLSLSLHAQQTWQWGKRGGSYSTRLNLTPFRETVVDMATDPHGNVYVAAMVGGDGLTVDGATPNFHFPGTQYGAPEKYVEGGLLVSYDCDGNYRWSKLISGTSYCGIRSVGTDTLGNVHIVASAFPATKDVWGTEYRAHFDTDTILPYSDNPKRYKQGIFLVKYDTLGNMTSFHTPQHDSITLKEAAYTLFDPYMIVDPDGTVPRCIVILRALP